MQEKRISNKTAGGLMALALVFDAISLIPLVRLPAAALAQVLLIWLFSRKGVDALKSKKAVALFAGTFFELLPALSVLPALTIETAIIIVLSRIEDRNVAKVKVPK